MNYTNPITQTNSLYRTIIQCKSEGGIWDTNSSSCLKKSSTTTSFTCPSGEQLIGQVCTPRFCIVLWLYIMSQFVLSGLYNSLPYFITFNHIRNTSTSSMYVVSAAVLLLTLNCNTSPANIGITIVKSKLP